MLYFIRLHSDNWNSYQININQGNSFDARCNMIQQAYALRDPSGRLSSFLGDRVHVLVKPNPSFISLPFLYSVSSLSLFLFSTLSLCPFPLSSLLPPFGGKSRQKLIILINYVNYCPIWTLIYLSHPLTLLNLTH